MKKILGTILFILTLFSCGTDKIVVYTNNGNNGREEFLTSYAKENGFDIQVVTGGGADISNRLIAEKNKPLADVIFGLSPLEYEKLKKHDILEKYIPSWANEVPEGFSDKEGYYNAITIAPLLAIYNPDKVPVVPKDWVDLATNPIFKGKYGLLGLEGGTGKIIYASIVSRYRDDNGELKISKEGWNVVRQLFENGVMIVGDEDFYGKLVTGERPITMIWGAGKIQRDKSFNYNSSIMKPEIGMPFVVAQLSLVKGSKKSEEAKRFIDWLGSAEVQTVWAQKFGTMPAIPKALENSPEENKALLRESKIQELDWEFISENIDSWVEKATLQYIK